METQKGDPKVKAGEKEAVCPSENRANIERGKEDGAELDA